MNKLVLSCALRCHPPGVGGGDTSGAAGEHVLVDGDACERAHEGTSRWSMAVSCVCIHVCVYVCMCVCACVCVSACM